MVVLVAQVITRAVPVTMVRLLRLLEVVVVQAVAHQPEIAAVYQRVGLLSVKAGQVAMVRKRECLGQVLAGVVAVRRESLMVVPVARDTSRLIGMMKVQLRLLHLSRLLHRVHPLHRAHPLQVHLHRVQNESMSTWVLILELL